MKTRRSHSKKAFTLVELLVVIAIIAVLASVAFTAGSRAMLKGKQTTCLATATSLESAVMSYFNEYGSMPQNGMTTDTTVATCNKANSFNIDFMNILLGSETGDTKLNAKSIRFLTVREGKANRDGIMFNAGQAGLVRGLFDPWGGPYFVMMDGDYDEQLQVQTAAALNPSFLRNRRVAVWSNGPDNLTGNMSTGRGKVIDDVKTWR